MQTLIGKEATFPEGIDVLIDLREKLFEQITSIANNYPAEAFYQMPFAGADGYHSKTLVYSMWHIFRIEDIVAHELIAGDKQVLFTKDWLKKTKSPILTTGNELHDVPHHEQALPEGKKVMNGENQNIKVTSLIMNILSSLCAFSFAGIPMAIGTVGSFFSIGGIYDEKLSRMSFSNLFGSVFPFFLQSLCTCSICHWKIYCRRAPLI